MDEPTPKLKLTAAEKEARRKLAIRTVLDGRTQADVADFLSVHPVTVAKWVKAYRAGGEDGLTAKPVPGRPRFLTAEQEAEVRSWLLRKPTDFGFRTDLWTAARVAQLIRDRLGVAFHPNYLREWLSKPGVLAAEARPPSQTAEPAGDRCLARAGVSGDPKKVAAENAHLVLIDETGLFLNPLVRRTWSLVGDTPVVGGDGGHRAKVSVIGAVSVSPVAQRLGFYFATEVGGYFSADKVVAFLRDLLKHLRGKVVVIWDGGPNHQGPVLREFLRKNKRLRLERLPPYAPDLNPVEAVWSWLKWGRLANFVPDDLPTLDDWIVEYLIELKHDPELLRALWERSDLPFPDPPPVKE